MIEKFRHVIWDWNGTLLNDVNLSLSIINGILKARNLNSLSIEEYRNIFTFPVRDYYQKAGLDFSQFPFEELGREWIEEYEAHKTESSLHEGVIEVLEYTKEISGEQSILSAYSQNNLEEIIRHFKLDGYFKYTSGLNHIYASSKKELGAELMRKLELKKSEVLLIGDTVHDYEVACEIGCECILIANGHQNKARLENCNVLVLNNLTEILNF